MAKVPRRGNIIAQAAVMRKGGVHEKSKSAKRQGSKRKLRREVNSYMITRDGDHSNKRGFTNRKKVVLKFCLLVKPCSIFYAQISKASYFLSYADHISVQHQLHV